MSEDHRISSSEEYFQRYRETLKRMKNLQSRREDLDRAYHKDRNYLQEQINNAAREIDVMRGIITKVVEEGIDPTTARIMIDESYSNTLWSDGRMTISAMDEVSSVDLTDITIGSISPPTSLGINLGGVSYGTTGAIGALGAMGPSGSDPYGTVYSAGTNGPAGPYGS